MPTGNTWQRSSRCADNACVEVDLTGSAVRVRNCTNPETVLVFSHTEWKSFTDGVKAGNFDPR